MFSTCLFCNRSLGTNDVLEDFPVGRRLAFDAARGRLWVVCRRCERWNLSPLEDRWEAVEMCERLFRETQLRQSTENVGLARHSEGLELVRIGEPLRPEFAAWRYGDQFGRRRRKALTYGVGGLAVLAGISFGAPALLGGSGLGAYAVYQGWEGMLRARAQVKLRTEDDEIIKLKKDDLTHTRLRPSEHGFRLSILKGKRQRWFEGPEAERLAGVIVPKMNLKGGKKHTVQSAVREIERHGHPDRFLADVVAGNRFQGKKGAPGYIDKMPTPIKLALEMALHEEEERRALDGELWRLERAWKAAEELAAISDSLLLPTATGDFIAKHRGGSQAESEPRSTTPPART